MVIASKSVARCSFIANALKLRRDEGAHGDILIGVEEFVLLRRKARSRYGVFAFFALAVAGCSTLGLGGSNAPSAPTSVETVEYYPYQVKGYQGSYPHRTIVVLLPSDSRDLNGP